MLRRHRRQSAALAVLVLTAVNGAALVAGSTTAHADVSDGTLTVVVNRDEDGDSSYDSESDPPQPGMDVAVTDPAGTSVRGVTDDDGRFVLTGTDQLVGGQYLVEAVIPPDLSGLAPVAPSASFASFSTAVDLRSGDRTVRLGVAPKPVASTVASAPNPSPAPPRAGGGSPRFAVGDRVWADLDRSGRQEPGEPPMGRISVQLLNADGEVIESTISAANGRFSFDDLPAGTYAVRFAGVPTGFRLTPAGAGEDPTADSDPDYTGTTPPFTLGVGKPQVRAATAVDAVTAAYIHPDIDAGIAPLRYAIGDQVWLDVNADGAQQPDEPPAAATVTLLRANRVVASTTTDARGFYRFSNLEEGDYQVRFEIGKHRRFTVRDTTADPVLGSDVDPRTGVTSVIRVGPGAPDLIPAGDLGVTEADLVNATVSAGLVEAYAVGDMVWRDDNGNGVLDQGEPGLAGVSVELLDEAQRVRHRTTTAGTGRFSFDGLAGGTYRLRFIPPDGGLVFTGTRTGANTAVDSDADPDGLTAPVVLGEENPADTTVDAGLTAPAELSAALTAPEAPPVPADTHLSSTGGVAVSIPIAGLALLISGLSCLLAARRSTVR